MRDVLIVFIVLLYDIILVGATGYLVFFQGHSGWWFLLTLTLMAGTNDINKIKK